MQDWNIFSTKEKIKKKKNCYERFVVIFNWLCNLSFEISFYVFELKMNVKWNNY